MDEAILQLFDTCAAAGPRTAALTDLLHRAGTIIDHRIEIAVRGGMTDANQHDF